ncbi:hypothetical protein ACIBQ6_34280 [Nonomuraea sp. NPDC049655]|uniref:hypothetical protein n=1 Tax=Nonomuraea sp. NPDC049655 TaxID=3364355 RepID=UPI0037ACA1D9
MPDRLAHATSGLDDAAIRAPSEELAALIAAREPYLLRLKQSANANGAVRFQCPAAGTSPSVTCPGFDRLPQRGPSRPATVDLTDARQRAAHPAAKPRVLPPQPDLKAAQLPKSAASTITVRKDDLGHLDKFRQDLVYLSSAWIGTYESIRANTEGINGRLKGHDLDLGDPKHRPAHGRVAQTILVALLVTVANDRFLTSGATFTSPKTSPSHSPTLRRLQPSPSTAHHPQARAGHYPPHKPQNPSPCRSAPLTVGFAMPNGRISPHHQRPDTTRAFPEADSAVPEPGRTRFGNP